MFCQMAKCICFDIQLYTNVFIEQGAAHYVLLEII